MVLRSWGIVVSDFPYAQVSGRAGRDPQFRRRLIAKPRAALDEIGVRVPAGVDVRVVVDTLEQVHAVLPVEPGWRGAENGLVGTVLDRARRDPEFWKLLRRDPGAAFSEITGFELPARPSVVVVEEGRDERVIHLLPLEARDLESLEDVQALWGGPGYEPPEGTIESGDVCLCFTPGLESVNDCGCTAETVGPGL